MAKDNESMPIFDDGPLQPSEPQGFSFEQMVRCDSCLRANPPTRVNCIYCGTALPVTETTAALQKPVLRRLEQWEQGYNNILVPTEGLALNDELLSKVGDLLRLGTENVNRLFASKKPLPLARAATEDEAELVERKLRDFGVKTITLSDVELGVDSTLTRRARSLKFGDSDVVVRDVAGAEASRISWRDLSLLVVARLFTKQFETRERKSKRAENEILDASETTADESVVDLYSKQDGGWRIAANNFDFSCLGSRKTLLAAENFSTLLDFLREQAPRIELDDSYTAVRQSLEPVWPSERQTEARGWRRHRPGKYSTGDVTIISNESQFTRYSRLCYYLKIHPLDQPQ